MFQPIEPAEPSGTRLRLLNPVPSHCLPTGVQLSEYSMREYHELLSVGPTRSPAHRAIEVAIQKKRGGVLPRNWGVALCMKANVEAMEGL
jgi:hypothetical protein